VDAVVAVGRRARGSDGAMSVNYYYVRVERVWQYYVSEVGVAVRREKRRWPSYYFVMGELLTVQKKQRTLTRSNE